MASSVVQRAENEPPRAENGNIFRPRRKHSGKKFTMADAYNVVKCCKIVYDMRPIQRSANTTFRLYGISARFTRANSEA